MRSLFILALLCPLVAPASAGETQWQDIAPGVQLRLISTGQVKPDGTTLVGLEIDMPPTTKTYWRIPGDTGMPIELDFAGSVGVLDHDLHWPFPKRDQTGDYLDYVYYGPTVLPMTLTLAPGATEVELQAVLGICSDICIPAQAKFSLPLNDSQPDRSNALRLKQALALAPIEWTDPKLPFGTVSFDPERRLLDVAVMSADVDLDSMIVTTGDGRPMFGAPQKSREANLVQLPVLGELNAIDLEDRSVQIVFMTGMGAYQIDSKVTVAPTGGHGVKAEH